MLPKHESIIYLNRDGTDGFEAVDMDNFKTLLKIIAVILGIVLAFAVIGMVMTALQYLFWISVLCLAAVVAVKLLKKSDAPQLESKDPVQALKDAEHSLEEYKRKYTAK